MYCLSLRLSQVSQIMLWCALIPFRYPVSDDDRGFADPATGTVEEAWRPPTTDTSVHEDAWISQSCRHQQRRHDGRQMIPRPSKTIHDIFCKYIFSISHLFAFPLWSHVILFISFPRHEFLGPTSGSFRAITTATSTRASSSLPWISWGCRDVVDWRRAEERPEEPPEEIRLGDIEEAIKDADDTVDGRNPANQLRLVVYPIISRLLNIPGGAGFLPSTVSNDCGLQGMEIKRGMACQEDWHKVKGSNSMWIFKGASGDVI